ncbi:hypothetical protein SCLCIDRAFT_657802 [Scleroderma citrinum Foug A]|uniref:Uncharacterized protein n=1 Tax=Scleroderma citrinum Foug A TaxID=1036808 RepID=A0A0C3AGV1_9AGAM|nr:hypothetical protein SCLCIDRAFT_657802 [Scleroderma citrinum Foug A]
MSVPQLRAPQTKKEPLASTLQETSTTTSPVNLLNSIAEPRSRSISAESMFTNVTSPRRVSRSGALTCVSCPTSNCEQ